MQNNVDTIEGAERTVWKYSAEYQGEYYNSFVRCYQRQYYVSREWKVLTADEINFNLFIDCDCGNYIELVNTITGGLNLKYTCAECDRTHPFVLHEGLLVATEDTVMDDEEIFRRKHYARFYQPNLQEK